MEKVVVTGAGGFIGSHLAADQLQRNKRVTAVDLDLRRLAPLADSKDLECIKGDLLDPLLRQKALRGADTVYNLAAAHLSLRAAESEYYRVNVGLVEELARDALAAGVKRLVHCSSVGVYGTIPNAPATEVSPVNPEIAYERSKLAGEQALLKVHSNTGLPVVLLRPAWVYGPGCERTEKLFRSIAKGRFVVSGAKDSMRHCIYIRDMLVAFELAARAEHAIGEVFIVGDQEAVSISNLLDEIVRLTGARPPPHVPVAILSSAGLVAEVLYGLLGKEPPISRRTVKFFTANTSFDTSKAQRVLGCYSRYSLSAGLEETWRILKTGDPRLPLLMNPG
jgi:nucleoside-diphosphate-sugar epimerase